MIAGTPWLAAWLAGVVPYLLAFLLQGLLELLGVGLMLAALAMLVLGAVQMML